MQVLKTLLRKCRSAIPYRQLSEGSGRANLESCLLVGIGYVIATILLRLGVELNLLSMQAWRHCLSIMAVASLAGFSILLLHRRLANSATAYFKIQLGLMLIVIFTCGIFLQQERVLILTWSLMALVYGSLKLAPRELLVTALITLAGYSAVVNVYFEIEGAKSNVELEWYRWAWFGLTIPGLALISHRITSTQMGLRALNARLSESVEQVTRLATIDPLTGLPNRASALKLMGELCEREQLKFTLLHINLDDFKKINDVFGPDAGDKTIRALSLRLRAAIQPKQEIFRLSADEFIVLATETSGDGQVKRIIEQIQFALRHPIAIDDREIAISGSVGIAHYPTDAKEPSSLLACADIALREAKSLGRGRAVYFSAPLGRAVRRRLELERDMPNAVRREQLELLFQPKVNIRSRRITGVEALIRWRHPTYGLLGADEFIPIAESTGLIHEIGAWVIERGFQQARAWELMGLGAIKVAVNVSTVQLLNVELPKVVELALEKSHANPMQLEFEITESTFLSNPEKARYILEQISQMGLKIAIDDFGTGYSSLAYLKTLPIDHIKVDKSFIRGLPHSADDLTITKAIIAIAHGLSMRVIAEGVEDSNQLETLRQEGCDEYQGYYCSAPVTADSIERQIHTGKYGPRHG